MTHLGAHNAFSFEFAVEAWWVLLNLVYIVNTSKSRWNLFHYHIT